MDILLTIKALSNETRFNILEWLKHPEEHFGPQEHILGILRFQGRHLRRFHFRENGAGPIGGFGLSRQIAEGRLAGIPPGGTVDLLQT